MSRATVARAVTVAVVAAGVFALGASAGDVVRSDSVGDVKAPGLTRAELDALDIVSVRAIGEEGVGVVVLATFRGNVERRLGRGHLRNGAVALVFDPTGQTAEPAGLVTRGTNPVAVLRSTSSTDVGAVRSGRTITFFVAGSGYSSVERAEVATFASFGFGSRPVSAGAGPPTFGDRDLARLSKAVASDRLIVPVGTRALTCPELEQLQAIVDATLLRPQLATATGREKGRLERLLGRIQARLGTPPCGDYPAGGPTGTLTLAFVDSTEVSGAGRITGLEGRRVTRLLISVTNRGIFTGVCPSQMPVMSMAPGGAMACSGGSLSEGEAFTVDIGTDPVPVAGMGGQFSATLDDGAEVGPFAVTGP